MVKRELSESARVGKMIRGILKKQFPTTKFSVKSRNFAGGDAVDHEQGGGRFLIQKADDKIAKKGQIWGIKGYGQRGSPVGHIDKVNADFEKTNKDMFAKVMKKAEENRKRRLGLLENKNVRKVTVAVERKNRREWNRRYE